MSDFELSYTLLEIFERNNRKFPFWIKGIRARHKVMRITGWDEEKKVFTGELYTLDKLTLLNPRAQVRLDNLKGWLPC